MLTVGVITARQGSTLNRSQDLQRLREEEVVLSSDSESHKTPNFVSSENRYDKIKISRTVKMQKTMK